MEPHQRRVKIEEAEIRELGEERARAQGADERARLNGAIREAQRKEAAAEKSLAELKPRATYLDETVRQIEGAGNWDRHRFSDLGGRLEPCFAPGTPIRTPNGHRLIEQLVEGDLVLAYDFDSDRVVERRVVRKIQNWTRHLVDIQAEGEIISATRMHRFWVDDTRRWTGAQDLNAGMLLRASDGLIARVGAVHVRAQQSATYNLEVNGTHNYFVGERGVLVHNGTEFESLTKVSTEIYEVLNLQDKVVYVGKTVQGADVRFSSHLNTKADWRELGYRVRVRRKGMWDAYETAVWEQHYIEHNGGVKIGSRLENEINALTPENYDLYKEFGHNPCV
jgi:hypothetical protein